MSTVTVSLPLYSYDIVIAPQGLSDIGLALKQRNLGLKSPKILLVSHPGIFKHYGERVIQSLSRHGFDVFSLLLPAGERYKTLNTLQKIYDAALSHQMERSSLMVALGGGIIGDMTGFAAATWLRGVDFVQLPTSLLAMVDASIGGKTGVNHPQGKNLIGAFHQPRLVLIDPTVLQTLPAREFRAAMAEVIKYGVMWDKTLFSQLFQAPRLDQLRYVSPDLMAEILYRCAKAKAEVVMADEKEAGVRALLNLGHTIGHAIESVGQYRLFNHGESVAIGMALASQIAVEKGFWPQSEHQQLKHLLEKAKLPQEVPASMNPDEIVRALLSDKKVESGKLRFVLPTAIGEATLTNEVSQEFVRQVLIPK